MSQSLHPLSRTDRQAAIVAEARRWIGTPWHHNARVHGAGVDCAQLLIAVFSAVGMIPEVDTGQYPADWHLHREESKFIGWLAQFADQLRWADGRPQPGDIVMFNFGRHPAHAAIVTEWPHVIHAWREQGEVCETDLDHCHITERMAGIWRLRGGQ